MIKQLLDAWTSIYSNHAALRTGIEFMHIGGLVAGGGGAITVDLATITAARTRSSTLVTQLQLLKRTHLVVILGLAALLVSGVLLFAADVDTFISSRIFWMKMGLMVALLANGMLLVRSERDATHAEAQAWRWLHVIALDPIQWTVVVSCSPSVPVCSSEGTHDGCGACGKPRSWRFSIGSTPSSWCRRSNAAGLIRPSVE